MVNLSDFLVFYRKFSNMLRQQSYSSDSVVSFIEFPSYTDVLFFRKFVNYFNRFNKKSVYVVFGKRSIRNIYFNLYGPDDDVRFPNDFDCLMSSSRGIIVYTKDYRAFSLLLDAMARSNLNYLVKNAFYNSHNSQVLLSSFTELMISLNPERLFTEHSLRQYKLTSLGLFFIGGFLVSMILKIQSFIK
jgi:hypothetical protein